MADLLTFIGFETGGLEEVSGSSGSPTVQDTNKRSGTYAVEMNASEERVNLNLGAFSPGETFVIAFAIRLTSLSPSGLDYIMIARDTTNTADLFKLLLETDGDVRVVYNDDTFNTITSPFTQNQWHVVEIYFEESSSGQIIVYIDGTQELNQTGKDLSGGATGDWDLQVRLYSPEVTTQYDDFYAYYNATGSGDFLGTDMEVLGAYQNTVEDALDQGDTLNIGTWADMGDTPVEEEATAAGYSATADGHTICDEGARDGPAGDAPGTIEGAKWIHRLKRGGGAASTHSMRYGHNGDTTTKVVTLTTAYTNHFAVIGSGASQCPTNSEYFAQGLLVSGNQDILCADIWACLLHVAAAAVDRAPRPIQLANAPRWPMGQLGL